MTDRETIHRAELLHADESAEEPTDEYYLERMLSQEADRVFERERGRPE